MNIETSSNKTIQIRPCSSKDFHRLLQIWQQTGITLGLSESTEELQRFLDMNQDTFLVADFQGLVIGTVMGGFDGRRGLIHHLAVDPEFQNNSIATELLRVLHERFKVMKIVKYHGLIEADNQEVL
ncbi:GNAT family N-acetyltransferase, partial [Calditrichota bacterium]